MIFAASKVLEPPAMLVNDTTQLIADGALRIEPRWLFFMLKNLGQEDTSPKDSVFN